MTDGDASERDVFEVGRRSGETSPSLTFLVILATSGWLVYIFAAAEMLPMGTCDAGDVVLDRRREDIVGCESLSAPSGDP